MSLALFGTKTPKATIMQYSEMSSVIVLFSAPLVNVILALQRMETTIITQNVHNSIISKAKSKMFG